jgi:SAM-dependent methyltransferase
MTQLDDADWTLLAQLRERFIAGHHAFDRDYWSSARLLELYDATFAQRIAWKWRAVFAEIQLRGGLGAVDSVLDWGCGTAIAAREFAAQASAAKYVLWDRSAAAREFAAGKLREVCAGARVETVQPAADAPVDLLLVSHVLGELRDETLEELMRVARRARTIVWVEPGERSLSRQLMELRDQLLPGKRVLAPCTHSKTCGLNRPERERDWCHSFAQAAPEVFTRADWREFSRRLKIDLRSVPYAYFALGDSSAADLDAIRILGRPRLEKGRTMIDACDANDVRVLRVLDRDAKPLVKDFAEPWKLARPFRVKIEGERVHTIEAL